MAQGNGVGNIFICQFVDSCPGAKLGRTWSTQRQIVKVLAVCIKGFHSMNLLTSQHRHQCLIRTGLLNLVSDYSRNRRSHGKNSQSRFYDTESSKYVELL